MNFDDKKFIECLNVIAATVDGQVVLAALKDMCQWDKTFLASDNPTVSHFYAVKRGIYNTIRQHIRPEYLKKIEFDYTRKVVEHDRGSSSATSGTTSSRVATKPKRK